MMVSIKDKEISLHVTLCHPFSTLVECLDHTVAPETVVLTSASRGPCGIIVGARHACCAQAVAQHGGFHRLQLPGQPQQV